MTPEERIQLLEVAVTALYEIIGEIVRVVDDDDLKVTAAAKAGAIAVEYGIS